MGGVGGGGRRAGGDEGVGERGVRRVGGTGEWGRSER